MKLLLKRLGALVYDTIIVFLLLLLVTIFAVALFPTHTLHTNFLFRFTLIFVWFLLITICWLSQAQTLGMRTWNLKIETLDGQPIHFKHCFIRFIFAMPSLLFFGVGLFWLLFDKDQLALHDRFSKTRIIGNK